MQADSTIAQPGLLRRPHTVLGICEGLGEDFGFNPVYLRVAFAASLYFAPIAVIGSYLGLGLALAFARWAYPVPSANSAPAEARADASQDEEELRIAA